MLVSAGAVYGLAATDAFGYGRLEINGASITPESVVSDRLALVPGTNVFTISTAPLEASLLEIPAIAGADISIGLPGPVAVDIDEREPILVWVVRDRSYLVDDTGFVFAELGESPPAGIAELPRIADERARSSSLAVGQLVAPIDLDAASRLASLTPAQVGSAAARLSVGITDALGFVVRSGPKGWTAVFGSYVHSIRTPDLIPGQVQALTVLIHDVGEARIETAILGDDRTGTYVPRATPKPKPSSTPKP
jgi:hypothetical protein